MNDSNSSLIEGIISGNEEALHRLFDQYNNILIAFVRHVILNPLLAEDIVQDAFCTLWENRTELNPDLSIKSYLYKLVHRRCIDYLRKQKSQSNYYQETSWKIRELELTQNVFENHLTSEIYASEASSIIHQTIENLTEPTREIFQLSRFSFLKNSEIAEKIGLSVKAIEYHISKALDQLRKALKDFL